MRYVKLNFSPLLRTSFNSILLPTEEFCWHFCWHFSDIYQRKTDSFPPFKRVALTPFYSLPKEFAGTFAGTFHELDEALSGNNSGRAGGPGCGRRFGAGM